MGYVTGVYMKKLILLIILLAFCIFAACDPMAFQGEVNDVYPENSDSHSKEDVVKIYGNYFIRANSNGVYIIHYNNGIMKNVASSEIENNNSDIIVYNDMLIHLYQINNNTNVNIYNLTTLSENSYEFPLINSIVLYGNYRVAKVYQDTLYVVNSYTGNILDINETFSGEYILNNKSINITNKEYVAYSEQTGYYASITSLSLNDNKSNCYLYYGNIIDFAIYPSGIYAFFDDIYTSYIYKHSLSSLSLIGSVKNQGHRVVNRMSLNDDGNNISVVTWNSDTGSKLSIYDYNLKLVGSLDKIAKDDKLINVRYNGNYCYIVTSRAKNPVFKIDMSNVKKPKIKGNINISGYNTYLYMLDNNLAIGYGVDEDEDTLVYLCLFDMSNDSIKEIDTISSEYISESLFDPRAIYINRDKKLIVVSSIDLENEIFKVYIISYSATDLTTLKVIDVDIEEYYLFTRMHISGDYLYVIMPYLAQSYSLTDYTLIDSIRYKEEPIIEE